MPDTNLDVRTEPPARRHELIFETFAKLAPCDGFELINDHDPKPLYYQLEAEHKGSSPGTTSSRARRSGACASAATPHSPEQRSPLPLVAAGRFAP